MKSSNPLYPNMLRQLMKNAGISFREVAEETNIPERTLYDWAAGSRVIRRKDRIILAKILGCSTEDLAPVSSSQLQFPKNLYVEKGEEMDKKRREILRLIGMAGSTLLVPRVDLERLGKIIHVPFLMEESVLGDLEAINRHYWGVYRLSPSKGAVLDGVLGQLKVLVGLIKETPAAFLQNGLGALASDLAQLAGEVFFDNNDYSTAKSCYTFAAAVAADVSHYDLWACALVRNAFLPIYDHSYEDAIPLLLQARDIASRGDSHLVTKHWVAAVSAEAYAGIGDAGSCQAALDLASSVLGVENGVNGGWLRFDGDRLPEQRGSCFIRLKQPERAIPALKEALDHHLMPSRRRGIVLNDLAQAAFLQHDIEQSCTYAHEIIDIMSQGSSGMLQKGLYSLRSQLEPFAQSGAVKALDQHLSILT